MKSAKSEQIQVEWLISEIRDIDRLIAMHLAANSDFMAEQYEIRRLNYLKELISLLATSKYNSTKLETFPLINALTRIASARTTKAQTIRPKVDPFQKTIDFYRRKAGVVYKSVVTATKSVREVAPSYKAGAVEPKGDKK